jgi:predicted RNA-binding protein YlqC (UPF0109 family)
MDTPVESPEASLSAVLAYIIRNIVDDPDAVRIEDEGGDGGVLLRLSVAPEDMGKVIGRGGRTARAIRSVVRAAAARPGTRVMVEIVG